MTLEPNAATTLAWRDDGGRRDEDEPLRLLALSGGGAGGAFGAGALVGLTRSGRRPAFDVVTGVSTGALIAPFAFVGPAWDGRLAGAYTGDAAAALLAFSGVRPGLGLYSGERLERLVDLYVDEPLLGAVAEAHRAGRRLLVTSANLDAEASSVWDLGAIADRGGATGLQLFKDVLVASASLPGVFPPKMIPVEAGGERFEEMHVDGGTVSPLFMPAAQAPALRGARSVEVFALVNTTLAPTARATPVGALPVLLRSFELMLRSSYRNAVDVAAAHCALNGFAFHSAAVPAAFGGLNMLRYDHATLQRMFDAGVELGQQPDFWRPAPPTRVVAADQRPLSSAPAASTASSPDAGVLSRTPA